MSEVLLVTGMSGAGRSTVAAALEDLGWFVIDNLPLELGGARQRVSRGRRARLRRDRLHRGTFRPDWSRTRCSRWKRNCDARHDDAKILFLDAPDDVLIRRFEGNRRRHPLVSRHAWWTPSPKSGRCSPRFARRRPGHRYGVDQHQPTATAHRRDLYRRHGQSLRVSLVTFGYSYGIPSDVDLVFDCRFLPNPHWIDELRPLTGLDEPVRDYVLEQEPAQHFSNDVVRLLEWQIPAFALEGKSYLSIAIGCTGGRHRSVAIAEEIRRRLGIETAVFHRDIAR